MSNARQTTIAALLALALVVGAGVGAMAQGNSGGNAGGGDAAGGNAANANAGNASADGNESTDDGNATARGPPAWVAEARAARAEALERFHENRTAAVEDYRARLAEIRESYLENKTAVIEGCRADGPGDISNATEDEKQEFAQCVKNGLAPLKDSARENITAAREDFRDRMTTVRAEIIDWFRGARERALRGSGADGSSDAGEGEA